MKKYVIALICLALFCGFMFYGANVAKADELGDAIEEQIDNLDLDDIENYFNDFNINGDSSFMETLKKMLNGEYTFDYSSAFNYFLSSVFSTFKELAPTILTIVAIAIFCALINAFKSSFFSESISSVIHFVCYSAITVIILTNFLTVYSDTKNVIQNLTKLSEIMSPIILTLMTASGASASAGIFKPCVVFFASGITEIIFNVLLPLCLVVLIFNVLSNYSDSIKLKKFSDFFSSLIKWIIGFIILFYGIFITVQGFSAATYDGISIKATKYILSNSVPLIGGLLKDGFDLVVAGSILIKNCLGIFTVILIFYTVIKPIIYITALSLCFKLCASVIEPISDYKLSDICASTSKSLTYLAILIILAAFMMFIITIMMVFSASNIV